MCPTFTDDEVSKPVVNDADEEIGVVTSVEGDIAHVRPETDAVDSIKSSIGWDSVAEDTQPLSSDAVREITDDAVRLEGGLPMEDDAADPEELRDESKSVGERKTDRGLEADPTELAGQEPEAEFNPGDTSSRTDAAVEPDDDHRSTDAAVDLEEGHNERRSDRDEESDTHDRE